MTCYFFNNMGDTLLGTMKAYPICEEDFCDTCGDCLSCYGVCICCDNKDHNWVKYVKTIKEAKEIAKSYNAIFKKHKG